MKQITQNYRSGKLSIQEVPLPQLQPGGVLVRNAYSLISAGTERGMIELARKNLLEKARARPDLVRKVVNKARTEGVLTAYQKAMQRLESPMPLGYSSAGTVIAVGDEVTDFEVGDPVACAGVGYACHAEVVFVPRNLCVKVPRLCTGVRERGSRGAEEQRRVHPSTPAPQHPSSLAPQHPSPLHPLTVGLDEAAYTTLGAIALEGVRVADVRIGESVVVLGLGLVGLLTVQILKAAGCRVIGMDPNTTRCHLAEELGCDVTADNNERTGDMVTCLTDGYGADSVIITAATSSSEPVHLAGEVARERGRVVVVGIVGMEVPRKLYYEKALELHMSRSYGPGRYDRFYEEKGLDYPIAYVRWTENRNMHTFLQLLAEGKVDVARLTTHRFPIERAIDAYDLITEGAEPHIGVLLEYGERKTEDGEREKGEADDGRRKTEGEGEREKGKREQGNREIGEEGEGGSREPDEALSVSSESLIDRRVWLKKPGADDGPQSDQSSRSILHSPSSIFHSPLSIFRRPSSVLRSPTSDLRPPISVGVIGAGNFATGVLLPALRKIEGVELRGVCSQGGLSARAVAEQFDFAYCTSDPVQLFDDPEIHAVLIVTRPDSHADLVTAALAAGKHVFVEKPLAVNLEQLREVACAYQELQVKREEGKKESGKGTESGDAPSPLSTYSLSSFFPLLMVGFNRRFSPFAQKLKAFFSDRRSPLMAIYRVNAGDLPKDDWQHDIGQGGGRIIGEVGHFVDLLSYIAGAAPESVWARAVSGDHGGIFHHENAALTICFADGSIGTIVYVTQGASSFSKERLEIFGGGATGVIEDFRRLELVRDSHGDTHRNWLGQDKGHEAELAAFIDTIRQGDTPPVSFEDYVLTTLCTFQAVKSLRTGTVQPVDMSLLNYDGGASERFTVNSLQS